MKKYRTFAFLILLAGICVMVHAGGQLIETQQIYQEGNTVYEDLRDRVKGSIEAPLVENEQIYISKIDVDFETLKMINKDSAAWLYCPDTVIDYPVMKADDYDYYLNHLPDGTNNANGSLFIDYNCAPDFSGDLTVIYGHHMKSGKMFGSLKKYKEQMYYEEHPVMYLYTEQGNYRIDLIYGCVISAGQWSNQAFMYAENTSDLLAYAAQNTTFESDTNYEDGDKIIVLSTCSYEFDDARYILIGILKGGVTNEDSSQ